ncbi:MAG: hypothetical protein MPEBLZ_01473 [Candidatus Methanoperedens nitroreducens]|uniref:Uncharacterized protein n=1 Tax=Candidatus Methanoperedens nitratireducens TaxID=1392998 RepID=A0A0P8ABD2_9EURY|nr:hypothetical protein [Candidatus Methanoperedens sp. BLZ2]KAB2945886.1 MAG: hypothetical protein F9K14_09225 [Candidatus Methanoperedens sp.]KPQ43942.1 MAG: hypothetical protein MPEBLZ_01473 [Candidatus Methanoperedens sp. BLZ1]MBZ0174338.1 hypothetical protein [Candidatus Methanoperedens nitroreducens]CAG0991361.1 hypothetical protein METP2_02593 [Methanosarcinales archaeon]MCX9079872.1 hypothetical protein [Candidatus Methanoperedens sp.]
MDYWFGNLISDYFLYKIIEGIIAILSMVIIYLGIQIALNWKFLNKENPSSSEIISQKQSFNRSILFIFIAGFFMLIHEFLEGLEKEAPDFVTYELFELIALTGLVLFLLEWHKILTQLRKRSIK